VVDVGYCVELFGLPVMAPPVNMFTVLRMPVGSNVLPIVPQPANVPIESMPAKRIVMLFFMVFGFMLIGGIFGKYSKKE
jgi:hypothetical protein